MAFLAYTQQNPSCSKSSLSLTVFLVIIINLYSGFVEAHWINLHVWYEDIMEQQASPITPSSLLSITNDTRHHQLMQQDSSVGGGPDFQVHLPTPDVQYFHQPRPLPPCDQFVGLTQPQIDICRVFTDHMRSVIHGAKLGLSECRWQFRYHHWNCSSPPIGEEEKPPVISEFKSLGLSSSNSKAPGSLIPSFIENGGERGGGGRKRSVNHYTTSVDSDNKWNSVLKHGSKEVAFAHAVWSAAVTHAVARSCRDGSLSSCSCGKSSRPSDLKNEWRWGGCGDNLQYGYKFAADFVDSREKEKSQDKKTSAKALVNLHNNEAGRRAVLKKTKIACKCHGVSGSCALVTCWHQVPSFRDIGDNLKERHAKATLVKMNRRGRLQVKRSGDKIPSVHDLVYIENSPNYCVQNDTLGVSGPSGRICNRTSTGPDGCKTLCCNKGFTTNVIKKSTRCQCKFIWCCQVICQECKNVQKISACK